MFELHRALWPIYLGHQGPTMLGFDVVAPGEVGVQHDEVVGDNGVEFIILPICSDLCFVGHIPLRVSSRGRQTRRADAQILRPIVEERQDPRHRQSSIRQSTAKDLLDLWYSRQDHLASLRQPAAQWPIGCSTRSID